MASSELQLAILDACVLDVYVDSFERAVERAYAISLAADSLRLDSWMTLLDNLLDVPSDVYWLHCESVSESSSWIFG